MKSKNTKPRGNPRMSQEKTKIKGTSYSKRETGPKKFDLPTDAYRKGYDQIDWKK